MPIASTSKPAARMHWLMVWLGFAGISVAAVLYFALVLVPGERAAAIEVWRGRLSAMADDRKGAITAWLDDRRADARVVAGYPTVAAVLAGKDEKPLVPPSSGLPRDLEGLLDSVQAAYGYSSIYVVDTSGQVRASSTGSPPLEARCRAVSEHALQSGRAQADLHSHEDGSPMLAVTVPVIVRGRAIGTVLLSSDPGRWLYPLLRSEPIPSRSAESLLGRQVGDQIEYLSPLRLRPGRPMSFRLPATAAPLAVVAAIRGEEEFKEYPDYRGVAVLGAPRHIPGTDWGLVVKVDRDEALAGYRRNLWQGAAAIAGLLLAVAGLGFGVQRALAAGHHRELGESEARFALLRDHANDAILFASRDGVILDVNRKAEQLYVRRREDLLGLPLDELRAPEERAALRERLDALARDEQIVFEAVHRRPDGTRFPVEVSIRVMQLGEQEVFLSIVRDTTERKRAEEALRASEARFRQLAESLPQLVWTCRGDGPCDYLSPQWLEYTGISEAEQLGFGWLSQLHPDDRDRTVTAWNEAVEANKPFDVEFRIRRKDGIYRWFTTRGVSVRDGDGRIAKWFGTSTDVDDQKRVEEALKTSEERFRTAAESLTDVVYDWDIKEKVDWYGDIDGIMGYPPGGFPRTIAGWAATVHPEDKDRVMAALEGHLKGVAPYLVEYRVGRRDGEWRWWSARGTALRDDRGEPYKMIGSITDITERKQAEEKLRESEAKYRTLVGNIPQKIFMKDRSFRFVSINENFARDLGLRPDEVVGKVDLDLFSPELAAKYHADDVRIMETGKTEELEERYIQEGEETWVATIKTPVRGANGEIVGVLGVFWDITARIRAEEEVRRLNAELEQRVRDRTAQLEAANGELEAFSYSVSHDLRAPLRHVQGYVDMLAREAEGHLSEDGRRYMKTIANASREMGVLIDDLLAFSRMGRAEMFEVSVDLGTLVQDTLRDLEPAARERNIVWKIPPLPAVQADPAILKLALANLLGNAVKFTRPRDPAQIEIGTAGTEEGRVILFVRDNGVGFDPQYTHKLFGVFQRLHRADEFEGTGIGLANVRRIVARHGGRTWAEGSLDRGATFYFTLKPSASASAAN